MLRNGDWNYAVFGPDMSHAPGSTRRSAWPASMPLDTTSFVFSLEPLTKAAKAR